MTETSKQTVLLKMMLAGVHFGHQKSKWNPGMKPYVYTIRHNVHIINLEETQRKLKEAKKFLSDLKKKGGTILFIGTKRQTKRLIEEAALKTNMPYVNERWLGGTFTNLRIIRGLIEKLESSEKEIESEEFEKKTKLEKLLIQTEIKKLTRKIGGIRTMNKLPDAVFILDIKEEKIAITEARKTDIPIIALVDTNNDPRLVDYPIPANNDSVKSVEFILKEITKSLKNGK